MRKALFVGIDDYPGSPLSGCVHDATRMHDLLRLQHDGSPNFGCRKILSSEEKITRPILREAIDELFKGDPDVALLFFAGHGTVNNLGGYLVTPDAKKYDEGIPMVDVLTLANKSSAHERAFRATIRGSPSRHKRLPQAARRSLRWCRHRSPG